VSKAVATGRVCCTMPDPVPPILLGCRAVDEYAQGKGLGSFLLRAAILPMVQASATTGVRALLVHAIDDTAKASCQARRFHPPKCAKVFCFFFSKKKNPCLLHRPKKAVRF